VRALSKSHLETLRLTTRHQGRIVPTVAGVLLFGRERERHFPDAWIQVGRFRGADRSSIQDHAELRDSPLLALEAAIEFVHKHLERSVRIGRVRRTERSTLPPEAVREAVINAVVHADYAQRGAPIRVALFDDRLEIENPGLLPFGLTIDDIRHGTSRLRNRVIGRVFRELGLIEQWGSGIQRMTRACAELGLAEPRLEELGMRFRVTLETQPTQPPLVDAIDRAIVELLSEADGLSTQQIAKAIGRTTRAARTRLAKLVQRGLVREVGTSARDPRRRYYLSRFGSRP
jgi:predicted HTH transcriptional regulator